ncbi:MAG: S41 family peptidase [Aggregatilineales bacterium]
MNRLIPKVLLLLTALVCFGLPLPVNAQDGALPTALIQEDEGGVQRLHGQVTYTSLRFGLFSPDPYVIMFNLSEFVRNGGFVAERTNVPSDAQVLGRVTSDPSVSPFTYELLLPKAAPGAPTAFESGEVRIYLIALISNLFGDPFLSQREYFGAYRSAIITTERLRSGKLLLFAEDGRGVFPSGRGADGILFTEDDPLVRLPDGYTLVDISDEPFVFSRPRHATVDLLEAPSAVQDDFSDQSYLEAFDSLIALLEQKYAFSEYYGIDYQAIRDQLRPRAQRVASREAFLQLLYDLVRYFPDGHIGMNNVPDSAIRAALGGVGIWAQLLDDGRLIVYRLPDGLPAARSSMQIGAEIVAVNGVPVAEALAKVQPFSNTGIATPYSRLILQQRDLFRGEIGKSIEVTFRNPNAHTSQTVSLTFVQDVDGLIDFEPFYRAKNPDRWLPIETRQVDGYTVLQFYSFADDLPLTVRLWQRAIQQARNAPSRDGKDGLIIDMRNNGGGSAYLTLLTASTFFEVPLEVGNSAEYDDEAGAFTINPRERNLLLPPDKGERYDGSVVVIVSPDCASACEFFTYYLTLQERAQVVGYYGTAGLGGSRFEVVLPDGVQFVYTRGRALDADGQIHIEGKGIQPTIRVPITAENVLSKGDPLLEAAVAYLDAQPLPSEERRITTQSGTFRLSVPRSWRTTSLGARSGGGEARLNLYSFRNVTVSRLLESLQRTARDGRIEELETARLGGVQWTFYRFIAESGTETIAVSVVGDTLRVLELVTPAQRADYYTKAVLRPAAATFRTE